MKQIIWSSLCLVTECLCFFVYRSGLAGNSQNLGTFLSGISGLSELETVCGAVLCSQSHLSPPLQAAHAWKPQVPHGGILTPGEGLCCSLFWAELLGSTVYCKYILYVIIFIFARWAGRKRPSMSSTWCLSWTCGEKEKLSRYELNTVSVYRYMSLTLFSVQM